MEFTQLDIHQNSLNYAARLKLLTEGLKLCSRQQMITLLQVELTNVSIYIVLMISLNLHDDFLMSSYLHFPP